MAQIIDGKLVSTEERKKIAAEVKALKDSGYEPGLAVIIVGEDPASKVYVRNKHKACDEVGIYSEVHELPESTTQEELISLVRRLNNDDKIIYFLIKYFLLFFNNFQIFCSNNI